MKDWSKKQAVDGLKNDADAQEVDATSKVKKSKGNKKEGKMATRSDDTKGVRACVLLSDTSVSEEDVSQKKTKKLKGKKKKGASVTSSGDAIISFAPVRTPPAAFVRKAVAKVPQRLKHQIPAAR